MTIFDSLSHDLSLLEPEIISLRRAFHRCPELGFQEHHTQGMIAEFLSALGLTPKTGIAKTGIIADLEGETPGKTLLIRADMDALPVEERNQRDYASKNRGIMHACGHDAHMSAALFAAKLLSQRRNEFAGRVRFLFQPAEELAGGAAQMVDAGVLDQVDMALGAHVFTPYSFGTIATRVGNFFAGIDAFELDIIGKAGHGGMPQAAVDPIVASAHVIAALQTIVSRETKPGDPVVVSVTSISGGTASNVVVERVTLKGAIRWHSEINRERALNRLQSISEGICEALRAQCELRITCSAPVTINAEKPVEWIKNAAHKTGRAKVIDPGPLTVAEDISEFLNRVPGCLFTVGAGGQGAPPHHHHEFDIDERSVALTSEIFVRAALEALSLHSAG